MRRTGHKPSRDVLTKDRNTMNAMTMAGDVRDVAAEVGGNTLLDLYQKMGRVLDGVLSREQYDGIQEDIEAFGDWYATVEDSLCLFSAAEIRDMPLVEALGLLDSRILAERE